MAQIKGLAEANKNAIKLGVKYMDTPELMTVLLKSAGSYASAPDFCQHVLDHFGGETGLGRVKKVNELTVFEGMGPTMAAMLLAGIELGRRVTAVGPVERKSFVTPQDVYEVVKDLAQLEQEEMHVLNLDTKNGLLKRTELYKGNVNTVTVRAAEVFRDAVRLNATAIVVVHNHPSGDPTPSPEDISLTNEINRAGMLLGIELLDHMVVGAGRFVSLKERGLGFSFGGVDPVNFERKGNRL